MVKKSLIVTFFLLLSCYQIIFSNNSITNPFRNDGFGGQFQTIIYAVIYAELNNKKFVYTPFSALEHNYNNEIDFIAKKESLINFIGNFELKKNKEVSIKLSAQDYIAFFESNIKKSIESEALKKIKKNFRANKNINSLFNHEYLNIAIHIRRPNNHDNRIFGTDTPDSVFLKIINRLRNIYLEKKPLFHLYSQGNIEQFKLFFSPDIMLHINETIEDTFTGMVFADILVTGTSSLSYTAGIISDGIIYYSNYVHPPLPHWQLVKSLL